MNRTLLLAVLFAVLAGGAWYALEKNKQTGSQVSWDKDFAVKNPEDIQKVFFADHNGHSTTIERKDGQWIYNGSCKARASAVTVILDALTKVNVMYIPTQAAETGMVRSIAADGIKVEVYGKNAAKLKTYYVGGVTNDERGTFMIMEGAEHPYVNHIPSIIGQLRVRFLFGSDNWCDRTVFAEKPEEIQSIQVEYPKQRNESFRLEKTGEAQYAVSPLFSTTTPNKYPQRKGAAEAYLLQFEHKEAEAFETTNPERDSVLALVPFVIITVKNTAGVEKKARFWPVDIDVSAQTGKESVGRYYTDYNGEAFLLTQTHVFGPLFRGYSYFFPTLPERKLPN